MKRYQSDKQPNKNDYDPLDPGSSFYAKAEQEDPLGDPPEFIPAEEPPQVHKQTSARRNSGRRPSRKKRNLGKTIFWTLVSLAAVFLLLNQFVFRIRHVRVEGAGSYDPNEIVRMSGLDRGVSFFALSRTDVEAALSPNQYLQVTGFEKRFPSTLLLTVRVRGLCANVQFNSVWYMIDEEGFVLERMSQADPRNNLLKVTGMQVRDARVGSRLIPAREDQLNAYSTIMKELLAQGYVNEVSGIYVGDPKKINLTTRKGFTVYIGPYEENLMAKIAVTRGVAAKLQDLGKESGSIDVTDVSQAIYSP